MHMGFCGKPRRKGPTLGRPCKMVRWEDNTEMYLKVRKQDGVDWIHLAQDKGISRVVNKVTNHRAP
jgi:hypothetical protein